MSGPVIARWFSTVLDQTKPPAPVWRCSYAVTASPASGLCKADSRPGANAAIPWQLFLGSAQPVSVPKSLPTENDRVGLGKLIDRGHWHLGKSGPRGLWRRVRRTVARKPR